MLEWLLSSTPIAEHSVSSLLSSTSCFPLSQCSAVPKFVLNNSTEWSSVQLMVSYWVISLHYFLSSFARFSSNCFVFASLISCCLLVACRFSLQFEEFECFLVMVQSSFLLLVALVAKHSKHSAMLSFLKVQKHLMMQSYCLFIQLAKLAFHDPNPLLVHLPHIDP